jgi:hypothetical protein
VADRVRAGIIGTRFMGTVHARAVRTAGGAISRIAARITEAVPASSRSSSWIEVEP